MKKVVLLLIFSLAFTLNGLCQDITFKKNIVLIDGKESLKVDDRDPNNVSFIDLAGNELFFLKFIHNSKYGTLYTKTTFLNQKLTFTAQSYGFTKKLLLKKLLADGTLANGALIPDKVERFVLKYDEKIEDR